MVDKDIVNIVKLMEMEEFKTFANFLEEQIEKSERGCEYYSDYPQMAILDKGRKMAYQSIISYFDNNKQLLEQYADKIRE